MTTSALPTLADRVKAIPAERWDLFAATYTAELASTGDADRAIIAADRAVGHAGEHDPATTLVRMMLHELAGKVDDPAGAVHLMNTDLTHLGSHYRIVKAGDGYKAAVTRPDLQEAYHEPPSADVDLLEAPSAPGFTGTITDSLGRVYHYVNGVRVAGRQDLQNHLAANPAARASHHYHSGQLPNGFQADTHIQSGRDVFGSKYGTQVSNVLAMLGPSPLTMAQLASMSGMPGTQYAALNAGIKAGLIAKQGNGFVRTQKAGPLSPHHHQTGTPGAVVGGASPPAPSPTPPAPTPPAPPAPTPPAPTPPVPTPTPAAGATGPMPGVVSGSALHTADQAIQTAQTNLAANPGAPARLLRHLQALSSAELVSVAAHYGVVPSQPHDPGSVARALVRKFTGQAQPPPKVPTPTPPAASPPTPTPTPPAPTPPAAGPTPPSFVIPGIFATTDRATVGSALQSVYTSLLTDRSPGNQASQINTLYTNLKHLSYTDLTAIARHFGLPASLALIPYSMTTDIVKHLVTQAAAAPPPPPTPTPAPVSLPPRVGAGIVPSTVFAPPPNKGLIPSPTKAMSLASNAVASNFAGLRQQVLDRTATKNADGSLRSVVCNADDWRDVLPGYFGTNAGDVQGPAAMANNRFFGETLTKMAGQGNNTVALYGGGAGSGKGTAVGQFFTESDYPVRYDSASTNKYDIDRRAQQAEAAGFKVQYTFVDRHPEAAWEGVVERAIAARRTGGFTGTITDSKGRKYYYVNGHRVPGPQQVRAFTAANPHVQTQDLNDPTIVSSMGADKKASASGQMARTVPLHIAIQANIQARDAAIHVLKYEKRIPAAVIDNNHPPGQARLITDRAQAIAHLEGQNHDAHALLKKLQEQTLDRYEKGEIPEDIAVALLGKSAVDGRKSQMAMRAASAKGTHPPGVVPYDPNHLPPGAKHNGSSKTAVRKAPDPPPSIVFTDILASKTVQDHLTGVKSYTLHKGMGGGVEDEFLSDLVIEMGRDAKPRQLDKVGCDALQKDGWQEVHRGLKDAGGSTAAQLTDQFRNGSCYMGAGIYGNGIYVGNGKGSKGYLTAGHYASSYGAPGAKMRILINPKAKRVALRELHNQQRNAQNQLDLDHASGKVTYKQHAALTKIISDEGRFACLHGYDIIDCQNSNNFHVILNRNVVAVQDTDVP